MLVATASCVLGTACVDTPTPPETEVPFEARIDGETFVAVATDFSTYHSGTSLLITGIRQTGPDTYRQVSFQLENWHGPGTYVLTAPDTNGAFGYVSDQKQDFTDLGHWMTTAATPGQAIVTEFYPAAQIIKGTFSFVARSDSGQPVQSLTVTAGRFAGTFYIDP